MRVRTLTWKGVVRQNLISCKKHPGRQLAFNFVSECTLSLAKTPSDWESLIIEIVPSPLQPMIETLRCLRVLIRAALRERRDLTLENLALRQQLAVLERRKGVPRLKRKDRLFEVVLCRTFGPWRKALPMVHEDTVVGWQRKSFCLFWGWISGRKRSGHPGGSAEVRDLIRKMAAANPFWVAPSIHGELLKLRVAISERTVSRLLPCHCKPPSQTWRAFLSNPVQDLVSIDFFTVPTATSRI